MSSYVFMKILESRPSRYDLGIAWLSLGRATKVKRRIVAEHVRPGTRLLDIGAGTGTLAVLAARAEARVLGFDVSAGMLRVAREKVKKAGLEDRVTLEEMGVAGMDRFEDESFDVVASTLVFSELSPDERNYALNHCRRVLRPGGHLVLADEVRPRGRAGRLLHALLRIPLAVVTFVLTQTTTRAVADLEDRVRAAGFRIDTCERSSLDAFLYLGAVKEDGR